MNVVLGLYGFGDRRVEELLHPIVSFQDRVGPLFGLVLGRSLRLPL